MISRFVTFLLSVWTLWRRELVRFLRQRGRVFGALGTPLAIWFFIGSGIGSSFHLPGSEGNLNYLQYFFPGTILLVILFTTIFSSLSVIEDRKEGFLLSVLVAPISRQAIVLGKILGSATLAIAQGVLLLALSPLLGVSLTVGSFIELVILIALASVALSALGFASAWKTGSMEAYHSVMNLLLFPLWLFSGAVFPAQGAFTWIRWVMRLNPLSYTLSGLQHLLFDAPPGVAQGSEPFAVAVVVTGAFGIAVFVLSVILIARGKITGMD